ncbi:hypothetical protein ACFL6I_04915 [candidate division KSB1 bacterium]
MSTEKYLGNGILKTSTRPLAIFVDKNGNEYVCDKDSIANLDSSRSFEEQECIGCASNPFDIGG